MKETSLYSLFQVNKSAQQTEDASLNWLKYMSDGTDAAVFRLLQLLMDCVQDEDQLSSIPIFIDDIDRVCLNLAADLPLFSTFHLNKHLCLMGDFFTSILRNTISERTPFEEDWPEIIVKVFCKMVNDTRSSKSIKFFAGYCITYLLTALQVTYTAIDNVSSEGRSAFFALYTRLASALCEVFEMCLQTETYLPYLMYLFREALPTLTYLLTSKIFYDVQKHFVVRICRAVVSEMTSHIKDCITKDLKPVVVDALNLLVLKSTTGFACNSTDGVRIYRYLVNSDREIRRLTAKLFMCENPKSTVLKAIKYHRQYQNQIKDSMQLFIDAFSELHIFFKFKKMFQFVQKNGYRRSVACHAITAILNSVKYRQNKLKNNTENTKIWEPFFQHLATTLAVKIDRYDPIVYHNLLQFFFDVFNVETLMKNEKIAKYITDSMRHLSTNFSLTQHYMLAVRLAEVCHIRAIDPLLVNLTEMTNVVQECFNTTWPKFEPKFSSLELCLDITMKMYILLDLTDDDVNVFQTLMLIETVESCVDALDSLVSLGDSKVLAFFVMICTKVLGLLYDHLEQGEDFELFETIYNYHFQWLCRRLEDTHREPFLEYMIFNAVCYSLIRFMPQHTPEKPQSLTLHLNPVIFEHLNECVAAFIDKVSTCEAMLQARGMIRSLTKLYKIAGSNLKLLSSPLRLFSETHFDAEEFMLILSSKPRPLPTVIFVLKAQWFSQTEIWLSIMNHKRWRFNKNIAKEPLRFRRFEIKDMLIFELGS